MAYEIRGTMNRYSYCLKGYLHAKNHLGPRVSPKSKLDLNFRCNCPAPESAASLSSDADTALPLADELVRLGNAPKAGSIEIAAKPLLLTSFSIPIPIWEQTCSERTIFMVLVFASNTNDVHMCGRLPILLQSQLGIEQFLLKKIYSIYLFELSG